MVVLCFWGVDWCTNSVAYRFAARPLWEYVIKKEIEKGNNVLVVAHTNTLRGLMKHIDNIDGEFLFWFWLSRLQFSTYDLQICIASSFCTTSFRHVVKTHHRERYHRGLDAWRYSVCIQGEPSIKLLLQLSTNVAQTY